MYNGLVCICGICMSFPIDVLSGNRHKWQAYIEHRTKTTKKREMNECVHKRTHPHQAHTNCTHNGH